VWTGAAIVGAFAIFHGHAHGTEVAETTAGIEYMAGFALATAGLHAVGIGAALALGSRFRGLVRVAGAACAVIGVGLFAGMI
jgi:urease accessory protein